MWTKRDAMEAAARGEGCLGKARDDEPVFIIVGDDGTMPMTLRNWADRVTALCQLKKIPVPVKVFEAYEFAREVENWQTANADTVKIPD